MGLGTMILVLGIVYVFLKSRANNASSPVAAVMSAPPAAAPTPAPDTTPDTTPDTSTPTDTTPTKKTKAPKISSPVASPTVLISAPPGKMIYRGTGKVIPGSALFRDAKQCWPMNSGGCRPSTRWIYWKGKGNGGCIPFFNKETTIYAKYGAGGGGKGDARSIITQGGSGQTNGNCCVYSIGFDCQTGQAYAEEEGPHDKHVIDKIGGAMNVNIGPLAGKTIGIKSILWYDGSNTHLEGYVDTAGNGQWKMFYKALNPKGARTQIITHSGMAGDTCEEMRFRTDNIWPVDIDTSRSFIAELASPVSQGGSISSIPVSPSPSSARNTLPIAHPKSKTVPLAKAGFAETPDDLVEFDDYMPDNPNADENIEYWPHCDYKRQKKNLRRYSFY